MKKNILFMAPFLLIGCAEHITHYQPAVDIQNDPNARNYPYDNQQCQQLASNNSSMGSGMASNGLVGALIGGAGGAALGAIVGSPATGAAIGGTIGGLGGASKGGFEADGRYKTIFRNCMRQRGHNIVD